MKEWRDWFYFSSGERRAYRINYSNMDCLVGNE